ncbi:MAG: hypothetical protein B7Z73_00740 [Planctomycetia bacterium 21-64-5]|nr:MAG: hypothetical protein B7Z73_00740 [Planctomycetia bacterium 21-64-5]
MAALSMAGWLQPFESSVAAEEKAASSAGNDEAQTPAAKEPSDDEKEQLRIAKRHVMNLNMRVLGGADGAVPPVDRPLLAYGDPARTTSHGTLWAFGTRGRPDAFMELWQGTETQTFWYQSLIRAGDRRLVLELPGGRQWRPPQEKIARNLIGDAAPPSANRPGRLRQLKSLARRFTAYEVGDPDRARFELRLLVQPVHRYDDADHALQDGAAFIFAHGTNPELVLLIEALGTAVDQAHWHYSAFPSSSAELHVELDGHEVWMRPGAPGVVGQPTDDYWLFSLPAEDAQSPLRTSSK